MKFTLLDIRKPGDHKEFNAGYGTTFDLTSAPGRLLKLVRQNLEYLPALSYGYLAAILRQQGALVDYVTEEELVEQGSVVVLQASLIRFDEELEALRRLKTRGIHTIVVGPLVTTDPLRYRDIASTVITGDFENYFLEQPFQLREGVVDAGRISDLDALPFPDWSVYDYQRFKQFPILRKNPVALIQGSRSCTYKCDYCPYIINDSKYQRRSVANVLDEMVYLQNSYGVRSLLFRDPVFTLNNKWVKELCEAIIARGIKIDWACETRTDHLTPELISLMKESGLVALKLGVESSDLSQLEIHKRRPPSIEHQEVIISHAESIGVSCVCFFIIGLPEDTYESVLKTIEYAKSLNSSFANFTICTPLPGTQFYEDNIVRIVDKNLNHYDNFHPVMKLDNLNAGELRKLQSQAMRSFYLRPSKVLMMLSRLVS